MKIEWLSQDLRGIIYGSQYKEKYSNVKHRVFIENLGTLNKRIFTPFFENKVH